MADAPKRDAGLASGIINVSVQLFGAIGLATLGTIATDHTKALSASGHALSSALTGGYHLAYLVAAVCVAVGILAAFLLLRPPAGAVQQEVEELERDFERIGEALASAGMIAQRSSADLAAGGLRQLGDEVDDAGVLVGRGLALDVLLQLAHELGRRARARPRAARRPRARPRRAPRRAPPRPRPRPRRGGRRAPTRPRTARCGSRPRRSRRRCAPSKYSQPSSSSLHPVAGAPRAARRAGRARSSARPRSRSHALAEVAEEERRHGRRVGHQLAVVDPQPHAGQRPPHRARPRALAGGEPGQLAGLGLAVAVADLQAGAPRCQARSTSGFSASPAATIPRRSGSARERRALGDHAVLGRRHAQHVHALARAAAPGARAGQSARRAAARAAPDSQGAMNTLRADFDQPEAAVHHTSSPARAPSQCAACRRWPRR